MVSSFAAGWVVWFLNSTFYIYYTKQPNTAALAKAAVAAAIAAAHELLRREAARVQANLTGFA